MNVSAQRLSRWILSGVALFACLVVVVLLVRSRLAREGQELPPSPADFRIKEVRLEEEAGGKVRWRLAADQAELYEREGRTVMRNVTVTIEQPDRTWTLTGEEGEILDATKDVEIRKSVVLVSSDGLRLETDRLAWQARERRVWTTEPVTLFRDGAIVQGRGLNAWIGEQRTEVLGRLRFTWSDRPGPARPPAEAAR